MKKFLVLPFYLLFLISLSGCATYKFHHGQTPYDKGYVVARDDYDILEYTLGQNNTVPDRKLAKTRFLRRRDIVEDYYKKMELIENHFKMAVWDPASMFLKLIGGMFRLPFIAIADYRYEHDPIYREKVKKMEKLKDEQEEARVNALKERLNLYVQKDLEKEGAVMALKEASSPVAPPEKESIKTAEPAVKDVIPVIPEATEVPVQAKEIPQVEQVVSQKPVSLPLKEVEVVPQKEAPKETQLPLEQESPKPEIIPAPEQIKEKKIQDSELHKEKALEETMRKEEGIFAVIVAKPNKGYSPLKVNFYGNRSRSLHGRIVAFNWDFGDGDNSTKENPANTYYSATSDPKYFNVTLTVKDSRGKTAQTTATIEVLNK
ncbi:MAG: PKD domain-containing protein [Candidatus Omnitrophica bacterium]|nr:PKD domain-containing protein [Candidatus Omnitrophota bacterium]